MLAAFGLHLFDFENLTGQRLLLGRFRRLVLHLLLLIWLARVGEGVVVVTVIGAVTVRVVVRRLGIVIPIVVVVVIARTIRVVARGVGGVVWGVVVIVEPVVVVNGAVALPVAVHVGAGVFVGLIGFIVPSAQLLVGGVVVVGVEPLGDVQPSVILVVRGIAAELVIRSENGYRREHGKSAH